MNRGKASKSRWLICTTILCSLLTLGEAYPRDLLISEFMADNDSILMDDDGDYSDWIEILNTSHAPVDLHGWHLTDDATDLTKWRFPSALLNPGDYLVVFASEKDRTDPASELHTNFKLDGGGEYLALVRPDGITVEHEFAPSYPKQKEDVSYGVILDTTPIVERGAGVYVLVPSGDSLEKSWTENDFVVDGTWSSGTSGVGFNIANLQTAGQLLVDLDAGDLPVGETVAHWPNRGTLGGVFNLTLTSTSGYAPLAEEADYGSGAVSFLTTGEVIIMEMQDPFGFQIDAPPEIINGSDYSIESWVNLNPAQTSWENTFFAWGRRCCDVAQFDYGDSYWSGAYVSWANGDVGWVGQCGGLPAPDQFHHLAYTNDGVSSFNIYLDGSPVYSGNLPNVVPAGDPITVFNIYSDYSLHDGFVGSIAAVRVHDGVLTAKQVEKNFLADAHRFGAAVDSGKARSDEVIGFDLQDRMLGVNASAYVRFPFSVTDPASLGMLELQMRYDDGFVAYLNGVEVASRNAPFRPVWNSAATAERPPRDELTPEATNLTGCAAVLKAGMNVLAVHGLNVDAQDRDFLILPELISASVSDLTPHYFSLATPGRLNDANAECLADPVFGVTRGFFDTPFDVEIACDAEDALIHYTLDGSRPTETEGLLYADPVSVTTTTVLRAAVFKDGCRPSDVVTHTYVFLSDVIRQPASPVGFPSTWGPGIADYEMDPDVVNDPLYAGTVKEDLQSVPTLSLAVDRDDCFGPGGIYSNTWMFGAAWERRASVEFFDPHGDDEFQINAGLRIHGGVGRNEGNPKHSLRLLFKRTYGAKRLEFPLFPDTDVESFDSIVLRAGFNYTWNADGSPMADYIVPVVERPFL